MTPEQIKSERLLFERYTSGNGEWPKSIRRDIDGYYIHAGIHLSWMAWLARAELEYTKQKVPT